MDGRAEGIAVAAGAGALYGIVPDDFPGYVWKARVKPGDCVKAGDMLLSDKATGTIALVSPVTGTVEEVRRGERRHIEAVTVRSDADGADTVSGSSSCHPESDPEFSSKEILQGDIATGLKRMGFWAMMRQRPFDIVPDAQARPRDIYITAFDSAPLAGDVLPPHLAPWLEKGIETLRQLTDGKVYLAVREGQGIGTQAGELLIMSGPHPAGNAGVQIAATHPVNKGETVWTLDAATAARIGRWAAEGVADYSTTVAVTGDALENPHNVECSIGISMDTLLKGFRFHRNEEDMRLISGNVLTGMKVNRANGFLRWPYRQVSVIAEGAHADEFMGWASLNPKKFSVKRSFPAFLRRDKGFPFDARIKGGRRAGILTGEFDKVFPFDIYPEYLLKAIESGDIDRMEKLGIYEVAPEDFALPEFVDTSKRELQKEVRDGIELLRKEMD